MDVIENAEVTDVRFGYVQVVARDAVPEALRVHFLRPFQVAGGVPAVGTAGRLEFRSVSGGSLWVFVPRGRGAVGGAAARSPSPSD